MPVLDINNDPLGAALKAYLQGKKDGVVLARTGVTDDDHIPVDYFFRAYENMPEQEQLAIQFCRGNVLEVGAGAGSHAVILQQAGHTVKCIDISPGAVEVMTAKGLDADLADFYEYTNGTYDTVLMLMNGIGIAGSLDGLDILLKHCKQLLKPGGQLLIDSTDVIYIYNEDGINFADEYYGQMAYTMEYEQVAGPKFGWLYVDFSTLEMHAMRNGYKANLLLQNNDFSYLARITI